MKKQDNTTKKINEYFFVKTKKNKNKWNINIS